MSAEICKQYFLCSPTKKSHKVKSGDRQEAIKYIHTSLSIFYGTYYWGILSQHDENGVAPSYCHHIFCRVARSTSSKSSGNLFFLQERKVSFSIIKKVWTNEISIYILHQMFKLQQCWLHRPTNFRTRNQSILFRRFLMRWTRIWPQIALSRQIFEIS